ncbi:hypothetical protein NQ314_005987 [Rhamnusium bicolor]|uniref:Cytosolic non-specific dipeptidase n=1 Tax=Rhamnusium bicolor TaxID=1586634 RepID=A0AAV8ZC68_9CUCU|nr:hypothetical protein NQ314_005987 [Rhamnusium bicolor]
MATPHCYRTEHSETKTSNSIYGSFEAARRSRKIHVQPVLQKIMQYVDANRAQFVDNLAEAVKIKSITTEIKYKQEVDKMTKFAEKWLLKLHIDYECFNIGYYKVDGKRIKLPPIILASLDSSPRKKTVCVYLHLDVLKPDTSKWKTDPWTLHKEEANFYGCGVACGKGPLMSWFHVIEAFRKCQLELPVNLRFIIESMHHGHSLGLEDFIISKTQDFFGAVDYVVMCDSEWLGEKYPCVIYGTVDEDDNILINGFHDLVDHVTPDEELMYEHIRDFDPDEIRYGYN